MWCRIFLPHLADGTPACAGMAFSIRRGDSELNAKAPRREGRFFAPSRLGVFFIKV
jgi:hypothetical protein